MSATTGWGVFVTGSAFNGNPTRFAEVSFKDAGGTDLSTGGTASAVRSVDGGSFPASNAFDKDDSTDWWGEGSGATPIIRYTHSVDVRPARVHIKIGSGDMFAPTSVSRFGVQRYNQTDSTWESVISSVNYTLTTPGSWITTQDAVQWTGKTLVLDIHHLEDFNSVVTPNDTQRQPLLGSVPASYSSYLTAKEGDVSEDKMFVYRSGVWIPVSGVQVS